LEIYAPVVFKDPKDKKIRRREYNEKIREIVDNVVNRQPEGGKNETVRLKAALLWSVFTGFGCRHWTMQGSGQEKQKTLVSG